MVLKYSLCIICLSVAFAGSARAQGQAPQPQQPGVQGSAASGSNTSVSANQEGAAVSNSSASSAAANTEHASAGLEKGTEINATLSRPVDASKAKPGDEVTATAAEDVTSDGKVVIRKGSKLFGRVTSAQPRGTGSSGGASGSAAGSAESKLGIVFDRAVAKDGRETPINATIQAIAAATSTPSDGMGSADSAFSGAGSAGGSARGTGGGALGGVSGTVGGAVSGAARSTSGVGGTVNSTVGGSLHAMSKSAGAVGGLSSAGRLTSGSKGVFGLKDLNIASGVAGNAEGSVITSATRNVRLDGGTRMLLVSGAGATGNAAGNASGAANAGASAPERANTNRTTTK